MSAAEYVAAHGGYFIFWGLFWLGAVAAGWAILHYEVGRIVKVTTIDVYPEPGQDEQQIAEAVTRALKRG